MFKRKSILFVVPDYHCSFIYRNKFKEMYWRANIYVPKGFPKNLLYSNDGILTLPNFGKIKFLSLLLETIYKMIFIVYICLRYKFHFCYGALDSFNFPKNEFGLTKIFGDSFRIYLSLAKLFGVRFIFNPSGCLVIDTKEEFSKYDNGNVCDNCGWSESACNDVKNIKKFNILRRYSDINNGSATQISKQFDETIFKYKSLDLNRWSPKTIIPKKYLFPKTENLKILHSFYDDNRDHDGKNIKGSPFILDAIDRLKKEGLPVEYFYIDNIHNSEILYYQLQADIVVEQLIYGWWGSTGAETMALGKPVVCYLRPEWKENFLNHFKEYSSLPIVEANTSTIYEVLKKLTIDDDYRRKKAAESRIFAEKHFDINHNAIELEKILLNNV